MSEHLLGLYEKMSPDEQRLVDDAFSGEQLVDYIARVSPHLPPPRHVKLVCDIIERARWQVVHECISMPPRHAKTTTFMHAIPWWLERYPADTSAYFSYNEHQAQSKSRIARAIAKRENVQLKNDTKSVGEWRTEQLGGMLAGGVGGALTGQGVQGLFVVDDPYPNREKADSAVYRETVEEWFREVVITRSEGMSVIVMHTRWHVDDLIGYLTEKHGWSCTNIPALAEANDPLGRQLDEPLWPARFPKAHLDEVRGIIGEWSFAALYQGHPRPKGGEVFAEPGRFDLSKFKIDGHRACLGVDPATTAKTKADHSAIVEMAMKGYGNATEAYITHVRRMQVTTPQLVACLVDMQRRRRLLIVVEAVAGFKAVPQMLRASDPRLRIVEVTPSVDKFVRAQPCASAWNGGRVMVPYEADWDVDAYLQEMRRFTGADDNEDDQVDATAHAFNALYKDRPPQPLASRRGDEIPFA